MEGDTLMGKCFYCKTRTIVLRAFYPGVYVCEDCYKILDKPVLNHLERLKLRKMMRGKD